MNAIKRRWDAADEDHLLFLRDVDRLGFEAIAPRLDRSMLACQARYYGRLADRNGAKHYPAWHPLARKAGLPVAPTPAPPAPVAPAPAPPAPPRDSRSTNLDGLRDWADLLGRIAERGLTGGVFGDPPPGRSALDERLHGRQASLQPSLSRGVSNVG